MLNRRSTSRRERALSGLLDAALVVAIVIAFTVLLNTGGLADFGQRLGELVGDQFGQSLP